MELKNLLKALPLIVASAAHGDYTAAETHYIIGEMKQTLADLQAEDPASMHAMCAGWNALIASKLEGFSQSLYVSEAHRHKGHAAYEVGDADVVDEGIYMVVKSAAKAYNSGEILWEDIVIGAEVCGQF